MDHRPTGRGRRVEPDVPTDNLRLGALADVGTSFE
jgi:hypothetical protein